MKILLFIFLQTVIIYFLFKGIKLILKIQKNEGENKLIRILIIIIGILILIFYFFKHIFELFNKDFF